LVALREHQGAGRENRQSIRWPDGAGEMPFGYMGADSGLLQITVAEEHPDNPQVGAGLQQVRGEAVTQGMRMKCFADAGAFWRFAAGVPADPGADRVISIMLLTSGKTTM
jgi:hypothetical protein